MNLIKGSLEDIPKKGPVVIVSNHPFGILDGLLLGYILSKTRNDFKIIANRVFRKAKDLDEVVLPISFEENREGNLQNINTRNEAIRFLKRGGIIGGALDAWMLHPNFQMNKDDPKKMGIGLEKLVDHFDHICQLSGNSNHIGFGSDLDGLFGLEQTPFDMNTIADLQKFQFILKSRGYSDDDIENIFFKNWIRTLLDILD